MIRELRDVEDEEEFLGAFKTSSQRYVACMKSAESHINIALAILLMLPFVSSAPAKPIIIQELSASLQQKENTEPVFHFQYVENAKFAGFQSKPVQELLYKWLVY